MIKKLRIRFILVSLFAVLFVVSLTIGSINIYNYVSMENDARGTVAFVLDNGENDFGPGGGPGGRPAEGPNNPLVGSQYFLVNIDGEGNVTSGVYWHTFLVDEATAKEMALSVYQSGKDFGEYGEYRYGVREKNGTFTVAFVNIHEKIDSFQNFLRSSLLVTGVSFLFLAALIIFLSKFVFRTSEESYRKQKAFITNASHELKTPLTVISADLEIIEMDHGKDEWTESIRDQVSRLTSMTNQLVTLSRLDEGVGNYNVEPFSLSEVARNASNAFAPVFQRIGLNFVTDIPEDVSIRGNKRLIEELFSIFLDNASKYASPSKEVSLLIRPVAKEKAEIVFENGLDEVDAVDPDQLFERFYRSPNAKKSGSGIGLSIAREIVIFHKGKIKATREGDRIIFRIQLGSYK